MAPLNVRPSITILANDGTQIARYGGLRGDLVDIKDLPPYVPAAILAIEDRRFYRHYGIDPYGLARAMWANLRAGAWVQGGSTITQQLAKNLFLAPDKTLRRKVQEALMALRLELKYSKGDILTAYINRVYFGAGAYGIDSAARTYFGKRAEHLGLWESALLAGLLKAPSRFSPSSSPKRARDRAAVVIKAMEDAGYIDHETRAEELFAVQINVDGGMAAKETDQSRYFSDWIVNQIDSFVDGGGRDLIVRTTLSPELQKIAEEKQKQAFSRISPHEKISQTAFVAMSKDGAILAMTGGKSYAESQFNRATLALRQPGSTFKPFVYLAALEAGFEEDDRIEDAPIDDGDYRPKNYDDKYFGEVSLTRALALSLNTATIRLLEKTGVSRLLDVTRRLGLPQEFKHELATGLGAGETTLLDMTGAYAVIASGGKATWPYAVLSVEDSAGIVLYSHEMPERSQVFSSSDIRALDRMLVQAVAQGTGQAAQLTRGHVAGKTGTSQSYRDAWFVGYTDRFVAGVWMGNDDGSPMEKVSGGRWPARLWHDIMQESFSVAIPDFSRFQPGEDEFSKMLGRLTGGFFTASERPVYNP